MTTTATSAISSQPLPCLHALDPDGRVIYRRHIQQDACFPALRLGFLIVPRDLQSGFVTARLATDLHPPVLEQMVLAAFISRGHYARHVRRMQAAYAERLDALRRAIDALGRAAAPASRACRHARRGRCRRSQRGTRARRRLRRAASRRMPLSAYYFGARATAPNALLLGFGAVTPARSAARVTKLARAIETARRHDGAESRDPSTGPNVSRRGWCVRPATRAPDRARARARSAVVGQHREVGEIEARTDGAADERVVAERARGLPMVGRDGAHGRLRIQSRARGGVQRGAVGSSSSTSSGPPSYRCQTSSEVTRCQRLTAPGGQQVVDSRERGAWPRPSAG